MNVKRLIIELLNAKNDDKVFIRDEKSGSVRNLDFVNIIPSARNEGEIYLEIWDKKEGD